MNIGELKGVARPESRESAPQTTKTNDVANREPLPAATTLVQQTTLSLQSSSVMGARILSASLMQSVQVADKSLKIPVPVENADTKSAFDFEEIAKNVLSFVGGVIRGAKAGGADNAELEKMFGQAEAGVAKGIKMARKDLAGLMNDEIDHGIVKSHQRITEGLHDLRKEIFGEQSVTESLSASSSELQAGSLTIETKEGDKVNISFESIRSMAVQFQQLRDQQKNADENGETSPQPAETETSRSSEFNVVLAASKRFEFSVEGDLNEDELTAIADLVAKTADLADEFFAGDIDKAFEKALSIGFDEQSLTSFALQLTQTQQTQVTRTYQDVASLKEEKQQPQSIENRIRPIAEYLSQMVDVAERADKTLSGPESFDSLVAGIINQMKDVQVPDLIAAINRFNGFNKQRLEELNQPASANQP